MSLFKIYDFYCNAVDRAAYSFGLLAAFLLFLLCPIAIYEVVSRKIGYPSSWVFQVLVYIQLFMIWFGIAYTQKRKGHVSVDLVTMHLSEKMQTISSAASSFTCAILSAILTWQGFKMVLCNYSACLMTVDEIHHPVYWIQIPVVLGSFLLLLVFIRQLSSEINKILSLKKSKNKAVHGS